MRNHPLLHSLTDLSKADSDPSEESGDEAEDEEEVEEDVFEDATDAFEQRYMFHFQEP